MRGTTRSTGNQFRRMSQKSRPATSGNKNVRTGGSRMSMSSQMVSGRTAPLKGPDRGEG